MTQRIFSAFLEGLGAPLKILYSPRRVFEEIREFTRRYGFLFTASFYIGAWIGSAIISFLIAVPALLVNSVRYHSITSFLEAPFTAALYSFLVPVIAAGLDTILIIIPVIAAPDRPPLYSVIAVRASSLLPYTLRVPLLAFEGRLSFRSLVSASTSPIGLLLLLIGVGLTAYGLYKQGVAPAYAVVGALLPLSYKLLI
ncbi:MAG: hypothetical protein F7C33_05880 [Desulfurococcales archaeon]|nr:hypothetical protein [Desulfurococcales archaeon]